MPVGHQYPGISNIIPYIHKPLYISDVLRSVRSHLGNTSIALNSGVAYYLSSTLIMWIPILSESKYLLFWTWRQSELLINKFWCSLFIKILRSVYIVTTEVKIIANLIIRCMICLNELRMKIIIIKLSFIILLTRRWINFNYNAPTKSSVASIERNATG